MMSNAAKKIFYSLIGCFLCGTDANWVALANGFPVTGVTGLCMTIEKFTGINYSLIYYAFSVVILIISFFLLSRTESASIVFLSLLFPAVLWLMNHFTVAIIFKEKLIAAALMGVLNGAGTGFVLRVGWSFGGLDTITKIVKKLFFASAEMRTVMLCCDACIMLIMLSAFSLDAVAYAFVGQLVGVNSMNFVLFMGPKLYDIQIVADRYEEIQQYVVDVLHKTSTIHPVTGGYTGRIKQEIDCVCTSREYLKLREYLLEKDIDCFLKVMPMMHVFGHNKDFEKLSDEII